MMARISARDALSLWQKAGLLDQRQVAELSAYLEQHVPAGNRAVAIFSSIGAVLVGLGVMLFVASHWDGMSNWLRGAVLFTSYGVVVGLAAVAESRGLARTGGALWFLTTLILGANIFLLGQMFNFSLTFWQGPLLWMAGALAMGYATRSRLHAWLVLPLSLLVAGWLGGGSGWFTDDQWEFLLDSSGLLPLLGLAWVCLSLVARNSIHWSFAASTWLIWGIILIALPLLLGSLDEWLFVRVFRVDDPVKHWLSLAFTAALLAAAWQYGKYSTSRSRSQFMGVAGLLLLLSLAGIMPGIAFLHQPEMFVPYVVLVFLLSLWLIWSGLLTADPRLVNLGTASTSFVILTQYFSWSFRLLDRSIAFVAGGIVLILMSVVIEKQRRRLMQRMKHGEDLL